VFGYGTAGLSFYGGIKLSLDWEWDLEWE
jgi:hypothetical protein